MLRKLGRSSKYAVASGNHATAKQISREIDRQLRHERHRRLLERRILLLGTASSGKSTFLRSMRIISSDEFDQQEVNSFKSVIYSNVWRGVMKLLFVKQKLGIKWQNSKPAIAAVKALMQLEQQQKQQQQQQFGKNCAMPACTISEQLFMQAVPHFRIFWSDQGFRSAFAARQSVQGNEEFKDIGENLDYFLDHLDELSAPHYSPTQAHILRSRRFTESVFERVLEFKGVPLRIIDIGGHTNERRKWAKILRMFHGDLQSIIYIIASSTFNETYSKTNSSGEVVNKLDESYECLRHLLHMKSQLFHASMSLIVFFNKDDLLVEKVETLPADFAQFDATFDTNAYNPRNILHVRQHLVHCLHAIITPTLHIPFYTHFTCSIDTHNVSRVFADIRHSIMNHFLSHAMPS